MMLRDVSITLLIISGSFSWTPRDIPNCVLWLDASDVSNFNTSGNFSWIDETSGKVFLQSNSSLNPIILPNALGGRSVLRFNNSGLVGPAVLVSGDDTYIFVVLWRTRGVSGCCQVVFEQNSQTPVVSQRASLLVWSATDGYGFNGEGNDGGTSSLSIDVWQLSTLNPKLSSLSG